MEEALEFYDASTKKKFTASDWRLEVRQTDSGKVSYYAVADAPRSGKPTRRRVSADLAETHLIREQRPPTAYQYAGLLGVQAPTLGVLIEKVERGLPYETFERLAKLLNTSAGELADWLHIPARTLQRRKRSKALTVDESERLLRLSRIAQASFDLFEGDSKAAIAWLRRPNRGLGGESPFRMSSTELGGEEVLNLIGRLEYGVFS
jgi:putative toxin-antitoxin system antitoxin component (TIGR02293 family)